MSLKFRTIFFVIFLMSFSACSSTLNVPNRPYSLNDPSINSLILVPNQVPAPSSIKSIQLYANGDNNQPPIIELESEDRLTLSFDELTDINGQFRITFSHHDKYWKPSNIPQDWYLDGIGELVLGGGNKSNSRGPAYTHYEMNISQDEVKFVRSGNYLLHVSDATTGHELFSLPFFIIEDAGELSSTSQTIFNSGKNFSAEHRLFSTYEYPEFVEYPDFDLSFAFAQNRFWTDTRFSESSDFNTPGSAKFDLSPSNAFPANIDLILKDLSNFSQNTYNIIEWIPGSTPPEAILREDVINFLDSGSDSRYRTFEPKSSLRSSYANVLFRLEGDENLTDDDKVYILGDFNQWTANDRSALTLNPNSGYWEIRQLLKEGAYSYQYVRSGVDSEVSLNSLTDNRTAKVQEYMSFVYFNDPELKFDRLLAIEIFYAK